MNTTGLISRSIESTARRASPRRWTLALAPERAITGPTLALAAILALTVIAVVSAASPAGTVSAAAAPMPSRTTELELYREAVVNGVTLVPGTYRIAIGSALDSITFFSAKRPVVTASCRVGGVSGRIPGDSVFYVSREDGRQEIVRVVLADRKLAIDLVGSRPAEAVADLERAKP